MDEGGIVQPEAHDNNKALCLTLCLENTIKHIISKEERTKASLIPIFPESLFGALLSFLCQLVA